MSYLVISIIAFAVCALINYLGHLLLEKREHDDKHFAILTGGSGCLVIMTVMVFFGYRKDVVAQLQDEINQDVQEFRASESEKKNKKTK